ncbi:protease secretion system ABC transporter ATP-binding protein PrtD 3 [Rhizobium etli bv. phaseoli str. IE4803]|nr:protease secretion system ABC transporter ATP-binding protein PrtD 3 [Rhizobium etli bv. phaseoli str. IE4803]
MFQSSTADVNEPSKALRKCKSGLIFIGIASALINILYLTSSFFMLEVYDRVIPSKSIPTLAALAILALTLYAFQGAFEVLRSRMLVRVAGALDEMMNGRVFRALIKAPLKVKIGGDGLQPLRDFDQIRTFLSGMGPTAMFDLPWLPFYIVICFLFHPAIGYIAIGGSLVLAILTFLTNQGTRTLSKQQSEAANMRNAFAQSSIRNSEVIHAMGMAGTMAEIWDRRNGEYRQITRQASDVGNGYATLSKIFRIALQSGTLATGAILVIQGQASSGIIIAGSILTSRALAPVEAAIGNWRGFVSAQQSWGRLANLLKTIPEMPAPLTLAAPSKQVTVEGVASGPPSGQRLVISDVSFGLRAGSALGVIGYSASGKSSLARAMMGIWPTVRGSIRLDGAALDQWDGDALGRHIGYLPQDVELFSGTVAQNICRFAKEMSPEAVVAAARAARVHDLILRLPNGYETEIGEGGAALSAGQRQRIALARALYGEPFLVVLDEPNSNLDEEGERALSAAIMSVRARGGIVVVIAHRSGVLAVCDFVLMMQEGRMIAFGPKEEVLARVSRPEAARTSIAERVAQLKVVVEGNAAE